MTIRKRSINGWAAIALAVLALTGFRWALDNLLLAIGMLALGAIAIVIGVKVRRRTTGARRQRMAANLQRLGPAEFEHFIADLCRRDGCRSVRVVGGANDHAADVLYVDPRGRRGLIQAKRYKHGNNVGNEHVQMVNGTYRDAHGCTHASIVTTSRFTAAARQFADHVGIALVDETRLNAWIGGQRAAAPWN
ncbi:restriction endonuclease [Streptomyces sp. MZ04]|uniref:restriction endonuclease n=1 Tax=Streptomyces sp. MZ04 TaxID=2559236 RepID=UPI00107E942F|nr:restriction endonuclease [Streptomyces sp. MZ04]TGB06550.1 restriction endonuclease [Streptomyces sp. MZ04]